MRKRQKKRDELVAALDLLSSRLRSVFQSLSWALATNPQLIKAASLSSTTQVDVLLVTGPTTTTVRSRCFIRLKHLSVSRYGERQQSSSSTTAVATNTKRSSNPRFQFFVQASASSLAADPYPVTPPNAVAPTKIQENDDEEHDPEADASFDSFISDMSGALSSAAGEEHSEDEGTGPDEDEDEEEDDAENGDASPSLASEDEGGEEEESEADFDEEEGDEERSAILEDAAAPKHPTTPTPPITPVPRGRRGEPPSQRPYSELGPSVNI